MRWTFCGTLLSLSVTRSSRYSFTWKLTTGFSDSWLAAIFFIFTTEAFTHGSMRWTSGWTKSGKVSPLNIDGFGEVQIVSGGHGHYPAVRVNSLLLARSARLI